MATRRVSSPLSFLPLMVLAAAACAQSGSSTPRGGSAGLAVSTAAPKSEALPGPRMHLARTVPTGADTRLGLRVQPYAKCSVPGKSAKYYADADGLLQLFTRTTRSDSVTTLLLDCVDRDGRADAYALDVTAKDGAPTPDEPRDRIERTIEPLGGDLRAISDREIAKRGFPPRPDPEKAPGPYARWERLVSRPWSKVASKGVPMEGHFHGGSVQIDYGPIWAGAAVTASSPLLLVEGDWEVPPVTSTYPIGAESALWIGVDGWGNNPDGTSDLIQCGTRQDTDYDVEAYSEFWDYYAWIEYYGQAPGATQQGADQRVFTVDSHDSISADAWVCDAESNENPNGGFGCFYIADWNLNVAYNGPPLPIPKGVSFSGKSAEWIMEDPTECVGNLASSNCYLAPLADFHYTNITSPWANGPNTNGNVFASAQELWMQDSSNNTMAQGFVVDNEVGFQWVAIQ